MSKYANLEDICVALNAFIDEAKNQMAAIRACESIPEDKKETNVFLTTISDALWRELLTEIARMFDPASNSGDENCSFRRLREECLSSHFFPYGEEDELIKMIDSLICFYKALPIRKARNKQLAHHDMKKIFDKKVIGISIDEVERLVILMSYILELVYDRICFEEVSLSDYEAIKKKQIIDLSRLFNNSL